MEFAARRTACAVQPVAGIGVADIIELTAFDLRGKRFLAHHGLGGVAAIVIVAVAVILVIGVLGAQTVGSLHRMQTPCAVS